MLRGGCKDRTLLYVTVGYNKTMLMTTAMSAAPSVCLQLMPSSVRHHQCRSNSDADDDVRMFVLSREWHRWTQLIHSMLIGAVKCWQLAHRQRRTCCQSLRAAQIMVRIRQVFGIVNDSWLYRWLTPHAVEFPCPRLLLAELSATT